MSAAYFLAGMLAMLMLAAGWDRRPRPKRPEDKPKRFDSVQTLTWELKLTDVRVSAEMSLTEFAKGVAGEMRQTLIDRPFPVGDSVKPGLYRAFVTAKATLTKWDEESPPTRDGSKEGA